MWIDGISEPGVVADPPSLKAPFCVAGDPSLELAAHISRSEASLLSTYPHPPQQQSGRWTFVRRVYHIRHDLEGTLRRARGRSLFLSHVSVALFAFRSVLRRYVLTCCRPGVRKLLNPPARCSGIVSPRAGERKKGGGTELELLTLCVHTPLSLARCEGVKS